MSIVVEIPNSIWSTLVILGFLVAFCFISGMAGSMCGMARDEKSEKGVQEN